MILKRFIVFLLLFLISISSIFAEKQTLIFLPFIELEGSDQKYQDIDTLIPCYLYFDFIKTYNVIYITSLLNDSGKHYYHADQFYSLDELNRITIMYKLDIIIGGTYKIKNEKLTVELELYGRKTKPILPRRYEIKIKNVYTDHPEINKEDYNISNALDLLSVKITKAFTGKNPGRNILEINTNSQCTMYLSEMKFSRTPGRYRLPAGDYDIQLVSPFDDKTVFQGRIKLEEGHTYVINLRVLSLLTVKSNVPATIYIDGKKYGSTNTIIKIPINNKYEFDIVYIDKWGEEIHIKDTIFIEENKDFNKNYIFPVKAE